MKRTLAVLAIAGLVIGGGAAAYAATIGGDPAARARARDCVDEARADHADDAEAKHAAVAACLKDAGVVPLGAGKVGKAVRDQVKALPADKAAALQDCLTKARDANPTHRKAFRAAAKPCLDQAGINVTPPTPEELSRRQKAKDCRAQLRKDQPDTPRAELRDDVRACVEAA